MNDLGNPSAASVAEVTVEQGRLRGAAHDGVVRYRGIPFARAARFGEPQPVPAWTGVRDATRSGPICPQPGFPLEDVMGPASPAVQDEDCLSLDIALPVARERPLPVMVWLHGGAYIIGAGSHDWYDGSALARDGDVIVVNVNYRLGAFGYLHWPGVSPPNLAVRDQLAALRWIARNIGAFGGDPQRVTLFGQSAGGHAIAALMSTHEAHGLFQRAIIQSAHLGVGFTSPRRAARLAALLEKSLGGADPRTCSAQQLLSAQEQARMKLAGPGGLNATPAFGPIAGFEPLSTATSLVRSPSDQSPHVDLLIGTVRDELRSLFEANPNWRRLRLSHPLGARVFNGMAQLLGRSVFQIAARTLADNHARAGGDVYTYALHWCPPGSPLGACHVIDLPFVFGGRAAWEAAPMLGGLWEEVDTVGREMRRAWTRFAREGRTDLSERWPRHELGSATGRVFGH
ncbi:MAG TPA: carboxylesterase family protein [Polyangiales bacterium]